MLARLPPAMHAPNRVSLFSIDLEPLTQEGIAFAARVVQTCGSLWDSGFRGVDLARLWPAFASLARETVKRFFL